MVTINTTDDLLHALAENPEWKAAVRREILTEELINLPARFDQFVAKTEQFMFETGQFVAKTEQFMVETGQFIVEQRQFNEDQLQFNDKVDGFMTRTDRAIDRLRGDISTMREAHARDATTREASGVAWVMGLRPVRTLTYDDLLEMHITADTSGIATNELHSFRRADLVIEAADDDGNTHYIAVEVSYTADERDTSRAIRNAGYLTRFTGHPAHAAIASIRNDRTIQADIDSGQVYWYELDDREPRLED